MKRCAAIIEAPIFTKAGATNTAKIIYAAEVGSPIPSNRLVNIASSKAIRRLPLAKVSIIPLIFNPSPVRLIIPITIPARKHAAAIGAMPFTEPSKAFKIFSQRIFSRFMMKPTMKVDRIA
ncbi:hypothetical protein SDC9_177975 [bioreactor metagenome]|uniref:Uncharacterized protein n=1 Tax=bioreactor metagenome TaxID=1076179 RepID=A0A645H2C5_9ZZZZ